MLKHLFAWLETHPGAYWSVGLLATAAFTFWQASALRRQRRGTAARHEGWYFAGLSLALLLAWRWPVFFQATPFNPDEAQLLAAALTYAVDPLPFRSVDLTTSGPLNGLALLPTSWLGLPQDYFNARLVALLLQWGSLLALFSALRRQVPPATAACALLPLVAFLAAAADIDLIHYTSEHVAIFLLALGIRQIVRHAPPPADPTPPKPAFGWIAAGFVLGLLPWAKLQSVPIGMAVGIWGLAIACRQPRPTRLLWVSTLVGGALLPTAAMLGTLWATGQFDHFRFSYLAANLGYMDTGTSWLTVIGELARVARFIWQVPALLATAAALGVLHLWRARVAHARPGRLYWLASATVAAAGYAVLAPRHALFHYLLLLIVPLGFWIAATALELRALPVPRQLGHSPVRVWAWILLAALPPFALRLHSGIPDNYRRLAEDWRHPYDQTARHIRKIARPGDRLAMWGWRPHLYVETGLPQGVREAHTEHQLRASPLRDHFFRPSYLAELRASQPLFFVDAVGPRSFGYDNRAGDGHETFPALRDYIAENYTLVKDFGGDRLYLLRAHAARRHGQLPQVVPLALDGFTTREALGEVARLGDAPPPPSSELFYDDGLIFGDLIPHHPLDLFAHAPSRLVHPVPPGTLRLRGAGAIRDAAYAEPSRGADGATFTVRWLRADGVPETAWEQRLDPCNRAPDRQPAQFDLAVPADATAVEFGIDPGKNRRFDWTYWHDLRFDVPFAAPTAR